MGGIPLAEHGILKRGTVRTIEAGTFTWCGTNIKSNI